MQPPPRRPSAVLALTVATVLFALMAAVAKRAAVRLPGPEVAFVRFLVGLLAVGVAATRIRLRANNWRGLFWRGAFGGAAVLCYFLAIEHLPVGLATLLNYTAPVFTALWAALFLDEPLGLGAVGALAVTTVGVALVTLGDTPAGMIGLGTWQLVGVASAVLSGAAVATIREVRKTDGSWEIFGSFCVGGALITGIPTLRGWVTPTSREWGLLLVVGVLSVAAQLLLTWSLRFLRAAVGGILLQITPVATMAIGFTVYGERTSGMALVGAAITLGGVCWGALLAAGPRALPVPVEEP
jgi:drug/metabolite transporter (DMT)-like permease